MYQQEAQRNKNYAMTYVHNSSSPSSTVELESRGCCRSKPHTISLRKSLHTRHSRGWLILTPAKQGEAEGLRKFCRTFVTTMGGMQSKINTLRKSVRESWASSLSGARYNRSCLTVTEELVMDRTKVRSSPEVQELSPCGAWKRGCKVGERSHLG